MKKYFRFSIIIALVCAVFACKDDEKEPLPDPIVTVAEADNSLTFSSEASEKTVSISANREVRARSSEKWCTPTITLNADQSSTIRVAVAQNEVSAKRRATVTVTSKSAEQGDKLTFLEIPVEQFYPDPFVSVAEADKKVTFTNAAGNVTIAVNANRSVEAKSSETWCTPTVTVNADKSVSLRIAVPAYTAYPVRTATVTVTTKPVDTDDETTSVVIAVEQDLPAPNISVAEADKKLTFMSDPEAMTIAVSANREIEVSSSEAWCTPTLTANSNVSSSLRIAVDQNSLPTKRTASVTITTKPAKTGDQTTTSVVTVEQVEDGVQVIDKPRWTIVEGPSFFPGHEPKNAIDGRLDNTWHADLDGDHTRWYFVIDFQRSLKVSGILYMHRPTVSDPNAGELPKHIRFQISDDRTTWTTIYETENLSQQKDVNIDLPCTNVMKGRYMKVQVLPPTASGGSSWTYIGEISIY